MKNNIKLNSKDYAWIGIGVDLPKQSNIYRDIVKFNKLLVKNYGIKKDFYPHLNIYDLSVPKDNMKAIVKKLKAFVSTQKSFKIKTGKINSFSFGAIFLEVNKSKQLESLHKNIVKEILVFKGEYIDKDYLSPNRKYTKRQKELLMTYGNPFVLDQFQPHITIGNIFDKKQLKNICKELNSQLKSQEFVIESVHITIENKGSKTTKKIKLTNI